MSESDKWGIKGLRTLMNNYPDYNAMVVGLDPASLSLDVTSPEYVLPALTYERQAYEFC
jgi:hypothetical protein